MHKWTWLYSSKTLSTKAGGGGHLAILCQSLSWTKLHHKGLHISRELRQKLQSLLRLKLRSHTAFFLLHSIAQRRSPGQPRSKVNRLHLLKECSTTSYCKVMYIQGWEEFLCPFLPIVYPPTTSVWFQNRLCFTTFHSLSTLPRITGWGMRPGG